MKTQILTPEEEDFNYPFHGRTKTKGFIVHFTAPSDGIIIAVSPNSTRTIGYRSKDWVMSSFIPVPNVFTPDLDAYNIEKPIEEPFKEVSIVLQSKEEVDMMRAMLNTTTKSLKELPGVDALDPDVRAVMLFSFNKAFSQAKKVEEKDEREDVTLL